MKQLTLRTFLIFAVLLAFALPETQAAEIATAPATTLVKHHKRHRHHRIHRRLRQRRLHRRIVRRHRLHLNQG